MVMVIVRLLGRLPCLDSRTGGAQSDKSARKFFRPRTPRAAIRRPVVGCKPGATKLRQHDALNQLSTFLRENPSTPERDGITICPSVGSSL
jgi:hypothetical protein